jgi:hypothetical protein
MKPITAAALLGAGLALPACERDAPADEIVNAVEAAESDAANSMINSAITAPAALPPNQPTNISVGTTGTDVRGDNSSVAIDPRNEPATVTINKQ